MASRAQGKGKTAFSMMYTTWTYALRGTNAGPIEWAVFLALVRYEGKDENGNKNGTFSRPRSHIAKETGLDEKQVKGAIERLSQRTIYKDGAIWPLITLVEKPCRGRSAVYRVNVPKTFEEWDRSHGKDVRFREDAFPDEFFERENEASPRRPISSDNEASPRRPISSDNEASPRRPISSEMGRLETDNGATETGEWGDSQTPPIEGLTIKGGVINSIGRGGGMFGTMPRATIEKVDPKTDPRFVEVPGSPDFDGIPIADMDRIPGLTLYLAVDGNLYTFSGGWHRLVS